MKSIGNFTAFQMHDKWYSLGTVDSRRKLKYSTIRHAVMFLCALPQEFPFPELGIDPDGMISMEWYKNPRCIVSVSVNAEGKIFYAALIGEYKHDGSFYGTSDELNALIKQVIGEENASNN